MGLEKTTTSPKTWTMWRRWGMKLRVSGAASGLNFLGFGVGLADVGSWGFRWMKVRVGCGLRGRSWAVEDRRGRWLKQGGATGARYNFLVAFSPSRFVVFFMGLDGLVQINF
jgi:hypothetical protein